MVKGQKFSEDFAKRVVSEFHESGESLGIFSKRHDLAISTLHQWVSKYISRVPLRRNLDWESRFVPVFVDVRDKTSKAGRQSIVIQVGTSVRFRVRTRLNLDRIIAFFRKDRI